MGRLDVAVVIPLFNKTATIVRALDGVMAQTCAPSEVIVIDDGSEDDGADKARSFSNSLPGVRLIRQENAGPAAARNRGVRESRSQWIAFLDADDVWRPKHLEELNTLTLKFPDCAVYGTRFIEVPIRSHAPQIMDIDEPDRGIVDYFSASASSGAPFFTSTVMANRDAIMATGGFPVGLTRGEDLVVWSLLAASGAVAVSSYVGGYYMRSATGLTQELAAFPNKAIETFYEIAARPGIDMQTSANAMESGHRLAILCAIESLMVGRNDIAGQFLTAAAGTTKYSRQRALLNILNRVPAKGGALAVNSISATRRFLRSIR